MDFASLNNADQRPKQLAFRPINNQQQRRNATRAKKRKSAAKSRRPNSTIDPPPPVPAATPLPDPSPSHTPPQLGHSNVTESSDEVAATPVPVPSTGTKLDADAPPFVIGVREKENSVVGSLPQRPPSPKPKPPSEDKSSSKSTPKQKSAAPPPDSSPPTKTAGKFLCCFCDREICDQDGVFLCKVCGALDCSCQDDFDLHSHPGWHYDDMWLGEERLEVFKNMFSIKP